MKHVVLDVLALKVQFNVTLVWAALITINGNTGVQVTLPVVDVTHTVLFTHTVDVLKNRVQFNLVTFTKRVVLKQLVTLVSKQLVLLVVLLKMQSVVVLKVQLVTVMVSRAVMFLQIDTLPVTGKQLMVEILPQVVFH